MAKDPPSQNHSAASRRFWRNVVLIALAHAALIAGLIRWSVAARVPPNPESIVWLGSTEGVATGESEEETSSTPKQAPPPVEAKPQKDDEAEEEKPLLTTAKSEIELPSPTAKPTATATPKPKPTATSTQKPKATPKPVPKPTPKHTLVAKASPKSSTKTKPPKSSEKSEKKEKSALAKAGAASQGGSGKTGSAGKGGVEGRGNSTSEFGWYGNMLHDRFYSAWIQPTSSVPTGAKISTLVKLRIEQDGRVSKFEIIKPSENVVVNESVAAIAKRVSEVDAPPGALIKGDHYDVKINFELSTDRPTKTP
jgi:outer membrane biosynthesis protein TonB